MTRSVVVSSIIAAALGSSYACGDASTEAGAATYVAILSGSRELPPANTNASGSATFTRLGAQMSYTVSASGVTTPLTVAFIHLGAAGQTGPVLVALPVIAQSGIVSSGSIDLSRPVTYNNITISGDSLRALFDRGTAYVNLYTAAFPGGEIRGQVARQ